MRRSFEDNLVFGQWGERVFEAVMRAAGFTVERLHSLEHERGQGPRIYGPDGERIPPDFRCSLRGVSFVVELKTKWEPSLGRVTTEAEHGIDHKSWLEAEHYQRITGARTYLAILECQPPAWLPPDQFPGQPLERWVSWTLLSEFNPARPALLVARIDHEALRDEAEELERLEARGDCPTYVYGRPMMYFLRRHLTEDWYGVFHRYIERHLPGRRRRRAQKLDDDRQGRMNLPGDM